MRACYLLVFAATVLFFSGCSKTDWWVGKWTFDQEATKQHSSSASTSQEPLSGLVTGLLFIALDGTEMTITKDEIMTMKNGAGKAKSYKVIERPSPTSVVLRAGDDVSTYNLEGEYMTAISSGSAQVKAYFKRVK